MGIRMVRLAEIRENPAALRAVNTKAEDYLGLKDSIGSKGFLGSITGREKTDQATGEKYVELMDGLHRYSACKELGVEEIPVDITSLDDAEVLEAQIMMNVHKIETKPAAYSAQLRRILSMNCLMTEAELASKLGKSSSWIKERLGLTKLPEKIANLVDEGKINLTNAYSIAKLPEDEMADWVDRAMTEQPGEFVPKVSARVKEIKDAKRKGQDAGAAEFVPVAHIQKLADLKAEYENPKIVASLCAGLTTPAEGFNMAIKWALHLDPKSVEAAQAKHEEQKAAREDAKKKRAAERAKKKADEAAEAAAKAAAEAS